MRILLVEDDALLGDGLRAGLAQRGFRPDWVRDGEAAAIELRRPGWAAVVLDLGLPRRDGLAVLAAARAEGPKLPVHVLTAHDAVADRVRGLDAGADDHVLEPVGLADADRERLGERFFRVPGADAPGSGLGWSIVRRIAALHGGRLATRRSAALGGLEVELRLPA